MYNIQNFTLIALLAILSYQMPSASAQNSSAHISPTAAKSTPTSTSTNNPTSETTIPPYYKEYQFLYPVTPDFSIIITSYKDTFNVSWEVFAPYDFPELWITCWLRNSLGRKSFPNPNILTSHAIDHLSDHAIGQKPAEAFSILRNHSSMSLHQILRLHSSVSNHSNPTVLARWGWEIGKTAL